MTAVESTPIQTPLDYKGGPDSPVSPLIVTGQLLRDRIDRFEEHLSHFVEDYRELRDRLTEKRHTVYSSIEDKYKSIADKPYARPFFSREGQQYTYMGSVLGLIFIVYIVSAHPDMLRIIYTIMMLGLIGARAWFYRQLNWSPFLGDFCYFQNYLTMAAIWTGNTTLVSSAQVLGYGPVLCALILWKNSLVFHSLDKMTSCAIHFAPALMMHVYMHVLYNDNIQSIPISFNIWYHIIAPILLYLLWQCYYIIHFDILNADLFRNDKTLQSSIRWWTTVDVDGYLPQLVLRLSHQYGIIPLNESFNMFNWSTKFVFYTFQLFYTIVLFPIAWCGYISYYLSCILLLINFTYIVNSGATFYLSSSYVKQRLAVAAERLLKQQAAAAAAGTGTSISIQTPHGDGSLHDKDSLQQLQDEFKNVGGGLSSRRKPKVDTTTSSSSSSSSQNDTKPSAPSDATPEITATSLSPQTDSASTLSTTNTSPESNTSGPLLCELEKNGKVDEHFHDGKFDVIG